MLSTQAFGYSVIVRVYRGAARWEVLAEGQSLACSIEDQSVEAAINDGVGAAATQAIDALVATGVAAWKPAA
jgi:hypothetical protein